MVKRIFFLLGWIGVHVLPALAQAPAWVDHAPASNFIHPSSCFNATISKTGGPGYGLFVRQILLPGVTASRATFLRDAVRLTHVGTQELMLGIDLSIRLRGFDHPNYL